MRHAHPEVLPTPGAVPAQASPGRPALFPAHPARTCRGPHRGALVSALFLGPALFTGRYLSPPADVLYSYYPWHGGSRPTGWVQAMAC